MLCCKGQFFHMLTLIWLRAPQKEHSLRSLLFLAPSTGLGICFSTNHQESFLLISVKVRLNHCTKGWVISPMYYVSHCFLLWVKENQQKKKNQEANHNVTLLWITEKHQPFPTNRLLAFWKVHCTGNKIVTIAYAEGCSWPLLLQLPPFYLT